MIPKNEDHGTLICLMSGVALMRYGPPSDESTRYEVIEEDHVAGFSRPAFDRPLKDAVYYFIDRANERYHHGKEAPCSGS